MDRKELMQAIREGRVQGAYLFEGVEENIKAAAMTALRKALLPEGLEEIHSRAFSGAAVEDINLPLSLRSIADDAFDRKPSRLSVILGSWAFDWAVA